MVVKKVLFASILTFFYVAVLMKDFQYIKIKRLKCDFNKIFFVENTTCFAKALSKNSSSINAFIYTKFPVTFLVSLSFLSQNLKN